MQEQQPAGGERPLWNFEGNTWLYREVIVTKEGVGAQLSVYPATIAQAR